METYFNAQQILRLVLGDSVYAVTPLNFELFKKLTPFEQEVIVLLKEILRQVTVPGE